MKWLHRAVALALLTITASYAEEKAPASFAPLEQWKAAVMAGDKATLAQFYATRPPAKILVGKGNVESLNNELQFWAGLTSAGVTKFNPKVLSIETVGNQAKLVLRVQAVHANQPIFASMAQIWVQQLDGWHLALSQRSDFYADTGRRLPEPAKPKPDESKNACSWYLARTGVMTVTFSTQLSIHRRLRPWYRPITSWCTSILETKGKIITTWRHNWA
jgi:hypothetical protein